MILLSLILIVIFSGCGEQGISIVGDIKDGLVIKKFWFDSSNAYPGDRVGLNLELQNIGEAEATSISATLFGLESIWWRPPLPLPLPPPPKTISRLSPSEPEVQIEGESRIVKWVLTAPDVETETNYDIGTRVIYKYSTVYTGTLRIIKDVYLETLTEQERSGLLEKNGVISSTVTGGPLSVSPVKGRNFVISSTVTGTIPIVFELTNSGSGYPSSSTDIDKDKYKVKISSQTGFDSCDSYGLMENGNRIVKLSKGESRFFNCIYDIPDYDDKDFVNKQDVVFSVTFDYYYYIDDIASIIVNPLLGI